MRVWQGQKGCEVLALAGVLAALGCQADPDRDPQVGGIAGEGAKLLKDPQLTMPVDPSSPGLEPPSTDGFGNAAGAGSAPTDPATPTASAGAPSTTPPPPAGGPIGAAGNASGAAGTGAAAGSGAGGTGQPMSEPGDAGTDAGVADPCESPECGVSAPCSDSSLDCISLDACDHAVCISVQAACQAQCGSDDCAVLESYPEQIACN